MTRLTGLIVALSILPQLAAADEIRHTSFVAPFKGTWALNPDHCKSKEKTNVVISETKYATSGNNCKVGWIVETAGSDGPTFSVHATCTGQSKQPQTRDMLIRPQGVDQMLIGGSFGDLKTYRRCQPM